MQFYKNIYQYNINGEIYSKLNVKDLYDNGCNFYEINDIIKNNKHYYVTSSISVGSSAAYYYQVKVFSIDKEILNENTKLIKIKSGLKNTLGYDVDLSSSSNRNRNDDVESSDFIKLIYDKKNKTILIPLINADGKITKNKIKYKFNGHFFEKI